MKERGFTLIELLAVIVILAIIALIATPIVLNIIEDTKNSSNKRSIELYAKAIENAIGHYQLKNPQDKDITIDKVKEYIDYKGDKVECETIGINKNETIYLEECKINDKEVEYTYGVDTRIFKPATKSNKTLAGNIPSGNFDLGDEYIINVDGEHKYHFYVLMVNLPSVYLIMSNNICIDGTLATKDNRCGVEWVLKKDYNDDTNFGSLGNSNKGPITAMNYLYEATKDWKNIRNMTVYNGATIYGGLSPSTGNKVVIKMRDGTVTASYENLKARLPNEIEIKGTGCIAKGGSCPAWMVNGLSSSTNYYPEGTKEDIEGIGSYWSLSATSSNGTNRAMFIGNSGEFYNDYVQKTYGVRPVIQVLKSDLLQ